MPETTTKTAAPRRGRTTPTKAPAKAPAATRKAAPAPASETVTPDATPAPVHPNPTDRFKFAMDQLDDTKTYSVFTPDPSTGCVGKLYVPKGTTRVVVLVVGPNDQAGDD